MDYEIIIDSISKEEWEQFARQFSDYSIYQTWSYQQVRAETEGQEISRIVIKDKNGHVLTMVQVRIKRVKSLGLRIGYVQRGPLLRRKDGTLNCTMEALRELRKAYLGTKVNVLKVVPNVCNNEGGQKFTKLLRASGFCKVQNVMSYQTMLLALGCSEEVLRNKLHQGWRRQLRKAEKAGLEIIECDGDESFDILSNLYLQTVKRKGFKGLDPQVFTMTQHALSPAEKMKLIIAYCDGAPVTAHLTSNLGESAVFLLAGSSEEGLACRSSYLAWWKAITLSNHLGMKSYDVGGIDFEENPTVSRFKAGVGGNKVSYIGAFEAYTCTAIKTVWQVAARAYGFMKSL